MADHPEKENARAQMLKPAWLIWLDQEWQPDCDFIMEDVTDMIRDMLLAPPQLTDSITNQTVQDIRAYYHKRYLLNDDHWQGVSDHATGSFIGAVIEPVFNLAVRIDFTDIKQERLANLLIGLKQDAAVSFDEKDPQLGWDDGALQLFAGDTWNHTSVSRFARENEAVREQAPKCIRTAGLLARLVAADLYGNDGLHWASSDIAKGLEEPEGKEPVAEIARRCWAVVATQWVLLAGDRLAEEVKHPVTKLVHPLTMEKWKEWAEKFKEISTETLTGED